FENPQSDVVIPIPQGIDERCFNAESDLLESLLNRDSPIDSTKIDSIFDEFSLPRPPEESNSEISDATIESFSPSPILIEDSDSLMEEIDLFLASDDSMPSEREREDMEEVEKPMGCFCSGGECPGLPCPLVVPLRSLISFGSCSPLPSRSLSLASPVPVFVCARLLPRFSSTSLLFVTAGGMHAVPPPMTGNYMPSGPDVEIDYSQFTYGPKQSQPSESETQTSDFDTCESDCSVETHESLPEPTVNEPKVVNQPKVWSDAPIIEEYESDSEDEHVSQPTKEQEQPSFASTNKQVKTPRETVKNQFTHSKNPTVDKKGLGYGFTARACFVCGSLSHLIRDCDFHEKRMAKQAELNNSMRMKSSQREIRPIWNNVQRVNHKNQFVPTAVLTRTGKIPVNTARASGTNNVSTARHDFNRQAVPTNAAMKVNTVKPIVNRVRPANNFKEDLFTYCVENEFFKDLQDTSQSADDITKVVKATSQEHNRCLSGPRWENSSQVLYTLTHVYRVMLFR
ncbi:hypothetical protein Tco_1249676, partial [Tanacetum coccineum]